MTTVLSHKLQFLFTLNILSSHLWQFITASNHTNKSMHKSMMISALSLALRTSWKIWKSINSKIHVIQSDILHHSDQTLLIQFLVHFFDFPCQQVPLLLVSQTLSKLFLTSPDKSSGGVTNTVLFGNCLAAPMLIAIWVDQGKFSSFWFKTILLSSHPCFLQIH